jgi:geranylgeranyl diphosphate synthase type I
MKSYNDLKKRVDKELEQFIGEVDRKFGLKQTSPLIYESLKEYITRDGKRIRPVLVVSGFLAYADDTVPGLFTTALSIEILHDFMLIHDDIIDKSDTRRGDPAMHIMLGRHLARFKTPQVSGADLAIVIGDILYALGIEAFLAVDVPPARKEKALHQFIKAGVFTGVGEFIELETGLIDLDKLQKEAIYRVYDYKTAYYTFAYPLCIGATLAGADDTEVQKLCEYGTRLGRAFQIRDDIIGMFRDEQDIGKSALTDLQEAKKTVLIWYAYTNGADNQRKRVSELMQKPNIGIDDLREMRGILTDTGALDYAKSEIISLVAEAKEILKATAVKPGYRSMLLTFADKMLSL